VRRLLQTPEKFTSLAALLRAATGLRAEDDTTRDDSIQEPEAVASCEEQIACDDIRLFRARVAEALESALEGLCRDLASEVLARELMLRPVDARAICEALIDRYAREVPVAIRVHPHECQTLNGFDVPIVADERLRRGDVMLDVVGGTLNASLAVRLDQVLCKRQP